MLRGRFVIKNLPLAGREPEAGKTGSIGSMRSWDNSLSIHAESGISQSNLEFAMTGSFAR